MNRQWHLPVWPFVFAATILAAGCNRDKPTEARPTVAPSVAPPSASATPESGGLKYIERMTGGAEASEEVPLVVAIHGLGDRPESFGRIFDGATFRARLILPYGPLTEGEGFSWFRVNGFKPEALAEGSKSATRELVKLFAELKTSRKIKGKPIATGFSQGGMLSFALAVLYPEEIAEALPVAGLLARPLYPASWPKDKPTLKITAFHGNADNIVAFEDGSDSVKLLASLGFTATMSEYPGVRHGVSAEMRRDWHAALNEAVARAGNR